MENDKGTAHKLPSPRARIGYVLIVALFFAMLAALVWPTIQNPVEKTLETLGLGADDLSRFWVAICVAFTSGAICFLVYFVAKRPLWDLLDILIVPLALATVGLWFSVQQDTRQQLLEEQRAQNVALQAYLDQMNHLMLEKGLPASEEGETVFTLAQARTTTGITQLDGEHNQAVTRFLYDSKLLRKPALLAKADLEGAKLSNAVLQEANLADTQLKRADLTEAVLIRSDFSAKEKDGEDIKHLTADLTRADLSKATLLEAKLAECTLDKVTLTKATLQGADLSSASLQDANLSYAALQDADLSSAESTGNLQDAPLRFLKEEATNLTDANLSHAALQDADLSKAVLQNANLTDAVLTGANLTDAYLSDANLTDARGWTMEQLTAARSLEGATMPDGQTLKSDKMPHGPTFEEWLKDKECRGENRENRGSS